MDLTDLLQCAQITEEQMQYSGLALYDQYVYAQQRNRRYGYSDTSTYNANGDQNGYNYNADNEAGYDDDEILLYVGPVCGGDSMSIKLAVYGDEYCTQRVDGITVKELLGYNPLSDNMDIFP